MEKDGELSGEGNSYTTQFRQYDPRIARWKSIDPLRTKYSWMSPYVALDNNPVLYADEDGKDAIVTIVGNTITITSKIYICGPGATAEKALEIQKAIMEVWDDKPYNYTDSDGNIYIMKFEAQVEVWKPSNMLEPFKAGGNLIVTAPFPHDMRSYVSSNGHNGLWNSNPPANYIPYPHEFGHILGLGDGYFLTVKHYGSLQPEALNLEDVNNYDINKRENCAENDIIFKPNGEVTQDDINLLGDYIMKHDNNKNGEWLLRGGGRIATPNTDADNMKRQGAPADYHGKIYISPRGKKANKSSSQSSTHKSHDVRHL